MNTQQGSLRAVVFDVDGTLIDSVDIHAQAWVDAFAEFGHEFRFADVRRQIGKGGDQLSERLEERRGALLKERYLHRIQPFPAVRELFQRVIADGKAIALASSAKEDELEQYLVIGDTPYDAEAAAKAGLRTVGLLCGGWSEDELRSAGCVAVFKDPADLLARYSES